MKKLLPSLLACLPVFWIITTPLTAQSSGHDALVSAGESQQCPQGGTLRWTLGEIFITPEEGRNNEAGPLPAAQQVHSADSQEQLPLRSSSPMSNIERVHVFPNPAQTVLNIQADGDPGESIQVTLTSGQGRIVHNRIISGHELVVLDISSLEKSLYFLSLKDMNGPSRTISIVVQ